MAPHASDVREPVTVRLRSTAPRASASDAPLSMASAAQCLSSARFPSPLHPRSSPPLASPRRPCSAHGYKSQHLRTSARLRALVPPLLLCSLRRCTTPPWSPHLRTTPRLANTPARSAAPPRTSLSRLLATRSFPDAGTLPDTAAATRVRPHAVPPSTSFLRVPNLAEPSLYLRASTRVGRRTSC
uniref:Uncharacterized protein n=1 Tax=Setaria viridis TaxID=4556 RepID=A0A4U6U4T5_SETVI|nr:hypothetical protein SEVIR_6G023160v2 [Setaria viridis]